MKKILILLLLLTGQTVSLFAQDLISGIVSDKNGEPLVGVFVFIKGSTKGVQTDLDGRYMMAAPAKGKSYTLCFQYLGMATQEIEVSQQRQLNITLLPDNELDAVMIVGAYGSKQRREDLVGSAFQVSSEELKDKPKLRIDNLLEGTIPGLTVEPNTDSAGSTRTRMETRVRGDASLSASNEPLWIVDGVPIYTGGNTNQMPGMQYTVSPLSFLDPDDIESITVLKDADQTTIYGANGANGVILVTTKSGSKESRLRVGATVNLGISTPDYDTMFKVMNAEQYMTVSKESWINAGYAMSDFPYQDNDYTTYTGVDTRWPEQYLGLGSELYARLNLRGGSKRITNNVSASYYLNNNIVQKDRQQRAIIHSKQGIDLWKGARLDINLQASYNLNDIFALGRSYLETYPIFSPYNTDGTYRLYNKIWDMSSHDWVKTRFLDNELPNRDYNDNTQRTVQTKGNFNFDYEIIKGLSLNAVFGIDYMHSHEDQYDSMKTLSGISDGVPVGWSGRADASYLTWTNSDILRYSGKFGRHSFELYGGLELRSQKNKYIRITGTGFANDHIKELEYAETISQYSYSNISNSRAMSYFGRLSYSFDSRYYLSANFRRDGNSAFGKYSKWGTFWSVGASWNINNEPWFHVDFMRMLKLKASYGTSGNSRVDSSSAAGTYLYGESYSYMGSIGAQIGTIPNPGLSWETTRMINIGLRAEFQNILDVEIEGYHNTTDDIISKLYISRTISDDSVYGNVGSVRNVGVELSLKTYNISTRDFSWVTTLNMSHNSNKVMDLYNGVTRSFGTYVWMVGYDKSTWNLVRWAGVDPSDGSPMWYDKNGNITKVYDADNRTVDHTKNASPILTGGMTNHISWKNLSLSFQINYSIGGYALATYALTFINDGYGLTGNTGNNQAVEIYYYRWQTPGQVTSFPKVSAISTRSGSTSTRFLYNKTSFSLSNIALTYRFPKRWMDAMRISDASVSFICNNVYLFTPDQKRDFNSYKTMKYGYPVTRTFTLGVNFNF